MRNVLLLFHGGTFNGQFGRALLIRLLVYAQADECGDLFHRGTLAAGMARIAPQTRPMPRQQPSKQFHCGTALRIANHLSLIGVSDCAVGFCLLRQRRPRIFQRGTLDSATAGMS